MIKTKTYFTVLFLALCFYSNADVQLPLLFSNDMVLQRNKRIPVWGWADAGEQIEISFNNQTLKTRADKNGDWKVNLKPEIAGGPYELIVRGKNTILISNVLVGEVWICSGQSNMEFTVAQAMNFEEEIKDSNYPMIRQFYVENDMGSTPKSKLKGGNWSVCNQNTVGNFTAVGFYFAKKIYGELDIPIGIISSSWGGTCVETWTSRNAFEGSNEFKAMVSKIPKIDLDSLAKTQRSVIKNKIEKIQGSKINTAQEHTFKKLNFNDKNWPEMNVPDQWEHQQLNNLDGTVWMRKTIVISKADANKEALLELAKIDDQDVTYINGVEVGTTNKYDAKRSYKVPVNLLKEGENCIAIRIVDYAGGGGIWGDQADLKLTTPSGSIPLAGAWKFNVVEVKSEVSPNSYPSLLYNTMINPLIPYAIQGVLWYQGEANVDRAEQYKKAFPLMIKDWRTQWHQGDFPFYFVQLSSFDEFGGNSNKGSKWAELREAQSFTLQTVANTGMAVTIDVGNAKDIHPTNKQDVGLRLSAIALNNFYEKEQICSGPIFKSIEVKGAKVIITFDNLGSGLKSTNADGFVNGFEIAGANKVFHKAKASIIENKVVLYSENVAHPIAVHYGWADDAGACNLYNIDGFPASPFRTDNWDGLTKGKNYTLD
ncbi:sialate O-acetylesterase [Tamlana sp. I1]|uniref:sialate O-acetylesterase n=1 Tax=Tamlana sp. I1 TaxID=2762061 RepID=UPI00188F2B18|nr:sialate O-acetylesterase [Tamlana sp. I1]